MDGSFHAADPGIRRPSAFMEGFVKAGAFAVRQLKTGSEKNQGAEGCRIPEVTHLVFFFVLWQNRFGKI